MSLVVIGDVHGKYIPYAKICRVVEGNAADCTLQLGDMGFSYGHFKHFGLSPDRHCFFGGNHDNYDVIKQSVHNIGDFGTYTLGGVEFFFVRGAHSIDQWHRVHGRDWWPEEELSMGVALQALEQYELAKPRIMITHDCPDVMRDWFTSRGVGASAFHPIRTRTGELLQQMYEAHQPEKWIFGHWHTDVTVQMGQTEFICVSELSTYRLEES